MNSYKIGILSNIEKYKIKANWKICLSILGIFLLLSIFPSCSTIKPIHEKYQFENSILRVAFSENQKAAYILTREKNDYSIKILDFEKMDILQDIELPRKGYPKWFTFLGDSLSYPDQPSWSGSKVALTELNLINQNIRQFKSDIIINGHIKGYSQSPISSNGVIVDQTGEISFWDFSNSTLLWRSDKKTSSDHNMHNMAFLKFSNDGKIIVAAAERGNEIIIIDTKSGKVLKIIHRPEGELSSLAITNDGQYISFAIKNKSIIYQSIYFPENKKEIISKQNYEHIRVLNNNRCLIAADSTGKISIWEPNTGHLLSKFQANNGWVTDIDISIDSSLGISVGPENDLSLWGIPVPCSEKGI